MVYLTESTDAATRIPRMRVAVVDVGANTLRLLVAEPRGTSLERIREERRQTLLGEDVERLGRLTEEKIERSAEAVRKEVRRARKLGATQIAIVVTSPWRNAGNGDELVRALEEATHLRVRALGAEEEAELAYFGALSCTPIASEPVAVCDVGGGSTQLAIGSRAGAVWLRSVELGSLRLTDRVLHSDPPTPLELDGAWREATASLEALRPPVAATGLATGGTARALRRLGLEQLDPMTLDAAISELSRLSTVARAKRARVDLERARTLPAGTIILGALQKILGRPLAVANGGVREGVCFSLFAREAATA